MKKKIIKPVILLLIILQIFFVSSSVFASDGIDIGDNVLLRVIKKLDDIDVNYYGQDLTIYYTVYTKNNIDYPVYCINYFKLGATDTEQYSVEASQIYIDENYTEAELANGNNRLAVWNVIMNGYPFKSFEDLDNYEAYAATKLAVFCAVNNWNTENFGWGNTKGKKVRDAMVEIVNNARSNLKDPTNTTITLDETEWKIDNIDNKFLSKKITLDCKTAISGFNVNLEGDVPKGTIITDLKNNVLTEFKNCKEFKVLIPLENLTNEGELKINVYGKVKSYPMYFGKSLVADKQNYVLTAGAVKLETAGSITTYYENKTKLIIKKNDNEKNILPGVKFNILDENKNVIFQNIETDENGIIEINNMVPGIYYLQETETLEGYEFSDELIEFKVDFNEVREIDIENSKIPEEPEKPEIPEEPEKPEIPEEPKKPEIPEEPKKPEEPEIPETPTPELPKLPRTGW